jgi:putative ABC transport system permease protein
MTLLNRLASGIRALIWRTRAERELDAELREYMHAAIEQKMSSGMSRADATRAARAEMGSVEAVKDEVRDVAWETRVDTFVQDLRFAVRSFLRAPRFTIPALLALALGIGATSAIFSVVHGVMLKPLPYHEPERIVAVWETNRGGTRRNVIAPANFVAWRERHRSFEYLGMVGPARVAMIVNGQPDEFEGLAFSSDVFRALGVQPALGRAYTAEEDLEGNDAVIVLSHEFWQTRLGGRGDVLDMALTTNGRRRTVIGVMPPRFTVVGQKADFLIPYGQTMEQLRATRGRGNSYAIARLREGASLAQASSDMRTIAAQLAKEAPQLNTGRTVMLFPVHEQMVEELRPALFALVGAVMLVLLVACVNVANLLLARSAVRERELGMRTALGARRGRLVRQMLTESLVLAAAGGIAGLAVAALFHRGLLALVGDRIPIPRLDQVALDLPVIAFTMFIALATGIIFGLAPAFVSTSHAGGALREGGRHGGGRRLRRVLGTLVVAEVALSLVLLAGAGLLMRSFLELQSIDPGFRAEGVLTARVQLPATRYDFAKARSFFDESLSRISALPGVPSAAGTPCLPLAGPCIGTSFWRADRPRPADGQVSSSQVRPVTPAFFKTMGIPQLDGRDFAASDIADSAPVAIVSETLVKQQFAGENPLGRRLRINVDHASGRIDMEWMIVGVVRDIKLSSLEGDVGPAIYVPEPQVPGRSMRFVVRSQQDPMSLANSVTRIVRSMDPEVPVADVRTLEDVVGSTIARPRAISTLVAVFALMALVLAAVGVYGVMAYSVLERTQEIGVRMALGATESSVFRLVLTQAVRLVLIGVVAGLVAAGALTRLLERLLYQIEPLDPWTFGVTALVLLLVATLASYLPARRGMHIAPVEALRTK